MSYSRNQTQQEILDDRYLNLSKRDKGFVEGSWAKPFAENVFPLINEDRFAVLYSDKAASRPGTPVNIIVGAMLIKEILGVSDEEMVTGIVCDVRIQYALHTTSMERQPLSDRSLSRFRERLYKYEQETGRDLMKEEIKFLAAGMAQVMKLQPRKMRMDSLMVEAACKDMTRLEVVYTTVSNLVTAVHRAYGDELLAGMEHYLNADDRNRVIYHNVAEESAAKIQAIIEDGAALVEILGDSGAELPEYGLVVRMLDDQSIVEPTGKRTAKNSHTIKPDSLQNPSDPDATYRKKAGKGHIGYVANVIETYNNEGAAIISDYSFEQNTHSDSDFCKEAIKEIAASSKESIQNIEDSHEAGINDKADSGEVSSKSTIDLIADGAFAGADNAELAKENGINLITTALTGEKPPEIFADFEIDKENHQVLQCPAGNTPVKQSRNQLTDTYRTVMEKVQCANCPHKGICQVKFQKKSAVVIVSAVKVERAKIVSNMSDEIYATYRNERNAVEGIPSALRRKYRIDEMPVFGIIKSKLFFGIKIGALNFKKMVKYTRDNCAQFTAPSYQGIVMPI